MKNPYVLDAWAVLALLQKEEPAASRVSHLLKDALSGDSDLAISIINLGEVIYRIGKVKGEAEALETLAQLRQLPLEIVPATEEAVLAAVLYKMRHAISYADAFAAATADHLSAILVTGDPELVQLEGEIQIEKLARTEP
ncbi:MAG: type II toxin-antitoxin system VapC family toxin [Anaerolineae bacterium]|jgi:predicted nucleic acid-binding protein